MDNRKFPLIQSPVYDNGHGKIDLTKFEQEGKKKAFLATLKHHLKEMCADAVSIEGIIGHLETMADCTQVDLSHFPRPRSRIMGNPSQLIGRKAQIRQYNKLLLKNTVLKNGTTCLSWLGQGIEVVSELDSLGQLVQIGDAKTSDYTYTIYKIAAIPWKIATASSAASFVITVFFPQIGIPGQIIINVASSSLVSEIFKSVDEHWIKPFIQQTIASINEGIIEDYREQQAA